MFVFVHRTTECPSIRVTLFIVAFVFGINLILEHVNMLDEWTTGAWRLINNIDVGYKKGSRPIYIHGTEPFLYIWDGTLLSSPRDATYQISKWGKQANKRIFFLKIHFISISCEIYFTTNYYIWCDGYILQYIKLMS
jgi:hypothetical protein